MNENKQALPLSVEADLFIPTGFSELDRLTKGLHTGELWVVAASPSIGKSAFALSVTINAARSGHPVLFYSLEMTMEEIYLRMLCSAGRLDLQQLRQSQLSRSQRDSLLNVQESLEALPVYIRAGADITLQLISSEARRLNMELETKGQKLALVVVDNLQMICSSNLGPEDFTVENEVKAKGLKEIAEELRVPVLTMAQLNRASERRDLNLPPKLSDLRESGSIEKYVDQVAFLKRNLDADTPAERNETTCYVANHCKGPMNQINLGFLAHMTMFADIAPNEVY